jgi:hypothetical protein
MAEAIIQKTPPPAGPERDTDLGVEYVETARSDD